MRRLILAAAFAAVVVGYVGVCGWFWLHQRDFQYAPGGVSASPDLEGVTLREITTEDGERIVGWWSPPASDDGGVVLYLHGTPGALDVWAPWRLPDMQQAGLGALAIDYRGYGGSTGSPSEAGITLDARAAYDFIRREAPQSKIAVFGESFGTGPAVTLATERPVVGVLLDAPFASELRLFTQRASLPLPYRGLLQDQWNSEGRIGQVRAPLLILHGTADDQVPIEEGRRLYAAAHEPKRMLEVVGAGHTQVWGRPAIEALVSWTRP